MIPGKLILLNGTTCSGKTSIVNALQAVLPEPYLTISIKSFLCIPDHDPQGTGNFPSSRGAYTGIGGESTSALAMELITNMHQSILTLIHGGHSVIAEHMLCEPAWLRACAAQFYTLRAWIVGVRCPLAVVEQRMGADGQSQPGQLQAQFDRVHTPGVYDMEVDTGVLSPSECASQVQSRMIDVPTPLALSWLNAYTSPYKHRGWVRSTASVLPKLAV